MQQQGKHTSIKIEEFLEKLIFVASAPRLYNENPGLAELITESQLRIGSRR
jgi:hypothetical protein